MKPLQQGEFVRRLELIEARVNWLKLETEKHIIRRPGPAFLNALEDVARDVEALQAFFEPEPEPSGAEHDDELRVAEEEDALARQPDEESAKYQDEERNR
jgi:hypothetical protein